MGLVQFIGFFIICNLCTILNFFERISTCAINWLIIALIRFFFYFARTLRVIFLGTVSSKFNLLRFDRFNSLQQGKTAWISLAAVSVPIAYLIQINCFIFGILHVTFETLIDSLVVCSRCRFLILDLVNVFYLRFDVFVIYHEYSTISKGR